MRGFAGEGELGASAVEFSSPFDELRDVFRAFFEEHSDVFGPAKTVAGINGVLLVQTDFVFVAEGYRDAALCPGRRRIA